MVPVVRSVRQFLLEPAAFFDERPPSETLPIAIGILALLVFALAASIYLVGEIAANAVDTTVTMDNPDRPPEWVCETRGDESESVVADGCDAPETIERDAGSLLREAVSDYLWIAFVGPVVLWIAGGIVLYGAGAIAGGTPSVSGAFALAGWAAVPEFVRLAVGVLGLWFALGNVTVTDLDSAVGEFEAAIAPIEPVLLVASLVTFGWQWYLLTGGLAQDADIPRWTAAVGTGIPLGILALFTLG